ncbi:hypothetical protein [Pseudomonas helleri]|uniref:hypothetical protein n=1 Tax=Pseudomonas helleri TaxID=1608996 RepID=UPI0012FC2181|nr:hypothetical protein [Pseudomonas helleri]
MEKPKKRLEWIERNNPDMQQWAIRYLNGKGADISKQTTYDELVRWSENWPENSEKRELLKNMKGAWRQKKLRESKDGRQANNFIISLLAKRKLKNLASSRKATITETLEWLIQSGFELKEHYKTQERTLNEDNLKSLRNERNAASILASKLSETLSEICKLELQIETLAPDHQTLPTPPKEKIEELFNIRKTTLLSTNSIFDAEDIRKYRKLIKPKIQSQGKDKDKDKSDEEIIDIISSIPELTKKRQEKSATTSHQPPRTKSEDHSEKI